MKYIVCKWFKSKGIGGNFNLKKGSTCNEIDGVIYHNNSPICYKTSDNAFEFFARNDDGYGKERFDLSHQIIDKIKNYVFEDNEELWAIRKSDMTDEQKNKAINELQSKSSQAYDIIREHYPNFLRQGMDVFTFDFFNAAIEDLEKVKELC